MQVGEMLRCPKDGSCPYKKHCCFGKIVEVKGRVVLEQKCPLAKGDVDKKVVLIIE